MRTQITVEPILRRNVFLYDSQEQALADDPLAHFRDADMIAIDGTQWPMLDEIRCELIDQQRKFNAPFYPYGEEKTIEKAAGRALNAIVEVADRMIGQLYPSLRIEPRNASFRPMVTGPEPMHFDTFEETQPVVTAFINVATTPREYCVGPSFPDLVREQPDRMREIKKACVGGNVSYHIRDLTVRNEPPMPNTWPAHKVDFAPGAIWFFCAKTVSHQIVHGSGAVGRSWLLPSGSAPMQADLLMALQ